MTRENNIAETPAFKERQAQIVKVVTDSARAVAKQARAAYPRKTIFPTRDRRHRLGRRNRAFAQMELMMMSQMAAWRMMIILSQPIPKLATDRVYPKFSAIIGETENPAFERLGYFDVSIENAFTPFAKTTITPAPSSSL